MKDAKGACTRVGACFTWDCTCHPPARPGAVTEAHVPTPRQLIRRALLDALHADQTNNSTAKRNEALEAIGDRLAREIAAHPPAAASPEPGADYAIVSAAERWASADESGNRLALVVAMRELREAVSAKRTAAAPRADATAGGVPEAMVTAFIADFNSDLSRTDYRRSIHSALTAALRAAQQETSGGADA